jgi:hypothetical protein
VIHICILPPAVSQTIFLRQQPWKLSSKKTCRVH